MSRIAKWIFKLTPFRIAIAITVAVLFFMLADITGSNLRPARAIAQLLEFFELKVFDFRLLLRGTEPAGDDIVLVAIDDKTLDELGRWPFSRSRMADAVANLKADGAKVIAWDVLFSEPDQNSELVRMRELRAELERRGYNASIETGNDPAAVIHADLAEAQTAVRRISNRLSASARRALGDELTRIEQEIAAARQAAFAAKQEQQELFAQIARAESRADNDLYFAAKIQEAENVILGYFFHENTEAIGYLKDIPIEEREALIAPSRIGIIRMPPGFDGMLPGQPIYTDVEPNIPVLSRATRHFGSFTIQQDSDGTIRNYPMIVNFRGKSYYPSLALKTVELFTGSPPILTLDSTGELIAGLQVGDIQIPVDERGMLLINYRGDATTFKPVSFSDVVFARFEPGTFREKIALIGPTAIGIMDLRVTPFDRSLPGVQVHANVIDNILQQQFYQKPNWMRIFDVFAVLLLGLLLGLFLAPLRAMYIGVVVAAVAALYLVGGQVLLEAKGIWLATVYPLLEVVSVSVGITIFKYYTEERQRKQIRSAFQFYLSPAVVEDVLKDPSKLRLGGQKRNITVLFSDVRGFTTISERLDAEELSALLNEYLTPMTNLVFEHGGTLDKYMGDAIMAFWGAPLEQPDHAFRACSTALEMMRVLHELQPKWEARGYPPIDIGIGLNTGAMSVGNMGSEQRFDYTVMGDAVNLGSRLEGINKVYGTHIIISEFTYKECRDQVWVRELDLVAVKGKKEPVRIYELLGYSPDPKLVQQVQAFEAALQVYRDGDFRRAFDMFAAIVERWPDDGPAHTFMERARELAANPPVGKWNGVYVATSK